MNQFNKWYSPQILRLFLYSLFLCACGQNNPVKVHLHHQEHSVSGKDLDQTEFHTFIVKSADHQTGSRDPEPSHHSVLVQLAECRVGGQRVLGKSRCHLINQEHHEGHALISRAIFVEVQGLSREQPILALHELEQLLNQSSDVTEGEPSKRSHNNQRHSSLLFSTSIAGMANIAPGYIPWSGIRNILINKRLSWMVVPVVFGAAVVGVAMQVLGNSSHMPSEEISGAQNNSLLAHPFTSSDHYQELIHATLRPTQHEGQTPNPDQKPSPLPFLPKVHEQSESDSRYDAFECISVLYPPKPGDKGSMLPKKPFVPKIIVPDPKVVSHCHQIISEIDDPYIKYLVNLKQAETQTPGLSFKDVFDDDSLNQPMTRTRDTTKLSRSSHERGHTLSFKQYCALIQTMTYDSIAQSGLFSNKDRFFEHQQQCRGFLSYIRSIKSYIKEAPVSYSLLDQYWYRVEMIDFLSTKLGQAYQPRTKQDTTFQGSDLAKVIHRLDGISEMSLAEDLSEMVLPHGTESSKAHPMYAHDPLVAKGQMVQILEKMVRLTALEVQMQPEDFRQELIHKASFREQNDRGLTQFMTQELTTALENTLLNVSELSHHLPSSGPEIQQGFEQFFVGLDQIARKETVSISHVASHMRDSLIKVMGHNDEILRIFDQVAHEFNHGETYDYIFQELNQYIGQQQIISSLYQEPELSVNKHNQRLTKLHTFLQKTKPEPEIDEQLRLSVARFKFREQLVKKLVLLMTQFHAIKEGVPVHKLPEIIQQGA
ncbi:MAG: hypothetical protein OXC40_02015, partial [Proteobacteria bacterium]|nr:hypothetical protein [Pseudomonadota bacterium]